MGQTLERLGVLLDRGLSDHEAAARRIEHGPNQLQRAETRAWWRLLYDQLMSMVVYLLGGAALLAFATGRWHEGLAVVAVLLVNTVIGFASEWKAVRSMAALREMGEHSTRVRRAAAERRIQAPDLVPGDIVVLGRGDLVPADIRLCEAKRLRVNEAPLTGESVPVGKTVDPVGAAADLIDRRCMVYKGTSIADGTGEGVVVATGTATELGHIAELTEEAEGGATPLQRRLNRLGRWLAWITVSVAVVVAAVGLLVRRQEATMVVETALALGIAAIPEGLPIVATIALARGMYLMARRNALVNRLTAVETLGATRVIFTDKTGTLTENQMELRTIITAGGRRSIEDFEFELSELERRAVEAAVLCNAATLDGDQGEGKPDGDPTEVALLSGGRRLGIEREQILRDKPELRVYDFDPQVKMMATVHRRDDAYHIAVKGGPSEVLDACSRIASESGDEQHLDDEQRQRWIDRSTELAAEGARVLAVADKSASTEDAEPFRDLCFVGMVGLLDPPRPGVKAAIDTCQAAGIRVAMVTGDHPGTARAIANAVGIVGDADDPEAVVMHGNQIDWGELDDARRDEIYRANIFARVTPEQKLELVRVYQERGEIVAMTGDGINDTPALKKADIGVAMGKRGTDAAKQVADMVLQDDAFESIVAAVEHGRLIFANIRKSVMFMLCTNVAEVLAVVLATLAGWTLPLHALQILYLNVLTDVFPALALGVGPGSGAEMSDPPRDPREPVLTRFHWTEIAGTAAVIAASVLGGLLLAERWLGLGELEAVTVSFLTLAFGKLWFTFTLRSPRSAPVRNEITRNLWVWGAIGLCVALLLAAVYLPVLSDLLQTRSPGPAGWGLLLAMSLVPFVVGQSARELQRAQARRASGGV